MMASVCPLLACGTTGPGAGLATFSMVTLLWPSSLGLTAGRRGKGVPILWPPGLLNPDGVPILGELPRGPGNRYPIAPLGVPGLTGLTPPTGLGIICGLPRGP